MRDAILVGGGCGVLAAGLTWLVLGGLRKIDIGVSREVIVGVVSGILASIVVGMMATISSTLFLPWYQAHAYKGLDLSGKWHIRLGDNGGASSHLEIVADLKQVTDRVSGILVVVFKDNAYQEPRTYTLSGFRREQFLALTIEKLSRKHVGVGTSLVETVDVGDSLRGYLCAYDATTGQISCHTCEWARADEGE